MRKFITDRMMFCAMMMYKCKPNSADDNLYDLQLPADDEVLLQKLREESRAVFLQRKSRELLDNEELQVKDSKSAAVAVTGSAGTLKMSPFT